jgi:hypothetical protein
MDGKQIINKSNPTGTGKYLDERGQYVTVPVGGGGSVSFTTVEVNLGISKKSGNFTITSSGLVVGKQVMIFQATGPYTGKGTLADESEMDFIGVNGIVTSSTTIKCFWNSRTSVRGNFKFNYLINT